MAYGLPNLPNDKLLRQSHSDTVHNYSQTEMYAICIQDTVDVPPSHLITLQYLNPDGHHGITVDVATKPFHISPQGISKPYFCPFLMLSSRILLSSSPSCSFLCTLQNCLCHARGSCGMAIPSECQFIHHG